jgi:adenine-specific DNA-methyltransferase
VQETHKPLISAAVLGLIFEKLNGYQDGSFYTPGFITMYMARHTLRRAVVQHFNRRYGYQAADIPALAEALDAKNRVPDSAYFNTLTVLDPAVGSGHFLVSALNELLAIKAELGLLLDEAGKRLRYRLTVARDELVVVHEDDDPHDPAALFQYHARLDPATGQRSVAPAHTNLQRALFHDKRHLIEHALFGVDINPNSVRICRLRLWVELLKHAYYIPDTGFAQLETLPNLDLNIKTGNSLLSRFDLTADLSDVFRQSKFTLATYRDAVHAYFNTRDRTAKQELQKFLGQIKEQFTQALHKRDPLREKLRRARNERTVLETQGQLLPETPKQRETRDFEIRRLTLLVEQYEKEVDRYEQGQLYRHAFEWRFEFPEVLDDKGQFRGFDVVLGNPPYIRQEEVAPAFKKYLKAEFVTGTGASDLYVYFYELGLNLLAEGGELSFITNNKWMRAGYGKELRNHLLKPNHQLVELIDFGDLAVFSEATTYPNILSVSKANNKSTFLAATLKEIPSHVNFDNSVTNLLKITSASYLSSSSWDLERENYDSILNKISSSGTKLGDYVKGKIYRGILTGLNPVFVIDSKMHQNILNEDLNSSDIIKPFLAGRDIKRYQQAYASKYLILIPSGWTRRALGWQQDEKGTWHKPLKEKYSSAWKALEILYPAIAKYLLPHSKEAEMRLDKGHFWWELRACDYYSEFDSPKILYNKFQVKSAFSFDASNQFTNDATYFIPGSDMYLLAVLNSKLCWFQTSKACTAIQGGYQLIYSYFQNIIIPHATPAQQAEIAALVEQVLAAKAAGEPTAALEADIDALVAARYGLTPAEVAQLGA